MDVVIDECAWHHVHNVGVICVPCWCVKVLHVAVWGTRPYAQVQHATNDFCIAPRLAESGAHSMDGLITMDGLMKEPSAQVQHATNDFCIAPRLAGQSRVEPKAMGRGNGQNETAACLLSRHFEILHGSKRGTTGSKCAKNICLSVQNGPGSPLGKRVFDPFWTHFWYQNGPFLRHFGIFHGSKCVTTGSKRAKNTCLSIPRGLGTTLKKIYFFRPGHAGGPTVGPNRARAGLPSGSTK